MSHLVTASATLLLAFSCLLGPFGPLPDGSPAAEQATTAVAVAPTAADRAAPADEGGEGRVGRWARLRFANAGLAFPDVAVAVHDHEAACDGHMGLFVPGEPSTVHLCATGSLDSLAVRRTALHELAHAWAHENLDGDARDRFAAFRHLDGWNAAHLAWEERASEHAAEIVVWALLEEDVPPVRLPDRDPAALDEAYHVLTGTAPPLRVLGPFDHR